MADLVFLGRTSPYLNIPDLGITIPWGVEVAVPKESANLSRDLWVAVGEKKILQLAIPDTPKPSISNPQPVKPSVSVSGETLIQEIRQTNCLLAELLKVQKEHASLLRELLSRPPAVMPQGGGNAIPTAAPVAAVEDIPLFIPEVSAPTITHKIEVSETSQESNVSKMGAALKARRQNSSLQWVFVAPSLPLPLRIASLQYRISTFLAVVGEGGSPLSKVLTCLRAMAFSYQTFHWKATGPTSYSDHLLFERLYDSLQEEIDSVGERIVGYEGAGGVDPTVQSRDQEYLISTFIKETLHPLRSALAMESFLSILLEDALKQAPSGIRNLLEGIADSHMTRVYLLQQRLTPLRTP